MNIIGLMNIKKKIDTVVLFTSVIFWLQNIGTLYKGFHKGRIGVGKPYCCFYSKDMIASKVFIR